MNPAIESAILKNRPRVMKELYDLCFVDSKPVLAPKVVTSNEALRTGYLLVTERNDKMFVRTVDIGRNFNSKETIIRFTKPHVVETWSEELAAELTKLRWKYDEKQNHYLVTDASCANCPHVFTCKGFEF